ncbi:DDE superfamily endonuclease [Rhizoctonia solani]|uniref:DDE superfamily endonuclease n=1 Tax=Rhizoctonia solani TaxID=456999 RepID=A0A8H8P6S9_9AGAM|nr:DDE superfamily endonuclease [Rhizoctonia solani]QRW26656.1 DDE superfamily endonuclease [Rhizoctonia solani]
MDEKGLQIGRGRSTSCCKHIFSLLQKAQYKLKHDSLELMTIIECICVDGFEMKPTFVHQPGDVGFWWENKEISCCVPTEDRWTLDDICEAWFTKVFLKTTAERQVSNMPLVLLLDGHGSHITPQVLGAAYKNNMFIICLPPKTTHKLQPLDVGVFNLVQVVWKQLCEDSTKIGKPITRTTAISRYMEAWKSRLHPTAIKDAWWQSGQHPLDPGIFGDKDYAPSTISSTCVHLPPSFPQLDVPVLDQPIGIVKPNPGALDQVYNPPPFKVPNAAQMQAPKGANPAPEALLQAKNQGLCQQVQACTKPQRAQDKAAAALLVQKHGFLMNPETKAKFQTHLAELQEKQAANKQKVMEKEVQARELEGKHSWMIADPNYVFAGTIQSYKVANLKQIGDLAALLALLFVGLKKANIFNNIANHFETHPELKALPQYSNLFCVTCPCQTGPTVNHNHKAIDQVPVMVTKPTLPPQP